MDAGGGLSTSVPYHERVPYACLQATKFHDNMNLSAIIIIYNNVLDRNSTIIFASMLYKVAVNDISVIFSLSFQTVGIDNA